MQRKDLKPGDVFRYDGSDSGMIFYVEPIVGYVDHRWYKSVPTDKDLYRKVVVIRSEAPPTTTAHYQLGNVEVIDAIEAWQLNFRLANVVKYVARAGKKAGAEAKDDLVKARTYLSREIAALEGRKAWE